MQPKRKDLFVFIVLCGALVSLAYGLNFQYFSEHERTVFGDRIKWWAGDSLNGPVRSNEDFAIIGIFTFFDDFFITSSPDNFGYDENGIPRIPGPLVILNAPRLDLPDSAAWIRQAAREQDFFFAGGDSMQARVLLGDHAMTIWWARNGSPFDSAEVTLVPLPDSAVVFFDCPNVRLSGVVHSVLIFGARGRIGLEDNVLYASSDPLYGQVQPGHPEKLAVVAEGEIKILNTLANGRENSGIAPPGSGRYQTDQARTSIALNGIFVALNQSFTFENQNDADSGYVCTCIPDDRGTIYLYGSLQQKRRGYVHRSSRNSTGYLKQYRYDNMLRHWNFGLWNLRENVVEPAELDFGDVRVGVARLDTVRIFNDYVPPWLDSIRVGAPFGFRAPLRRIYAFEHAIPVSFAPEAAGEYFDTLRIRVPYYNTWLHVPMRGRVPSAADDNILPPSSFSLSAYPNPFNARTTITFTLPQTGAVELSLFDLQGRRVAVLLSEHRAAGEHAESFSGANLPSGLYFARLATASRTATHKLLLIK